VAKPGMTVSGRNTTYRLVPRGEQTVVPGPTQFRPLTLTNITGAQQARIDPPLSFNA
jgi:hypothetical protein